MYMSEARVSIRTYVRTYTYIRMRMYHTSSKYIITKVYILLSCIYIYIHEGYLRSKVPITAKINLAKF